MAPRKKSHPSPPLYYNSSGVVQGVSSGGGGGGGGGGATDLDGLTDVDTTTVPPTTGDVLTFDGAVWEPAAPAGVTIAMDDLTDADTTSVAPAIGDVLTFDGANWVPEAPSGGTRDASIAIVTASLASGAVETGTVATGGGVGSLLGITTGGLASRVRLYATSAARTSDASRSVTVDYEPGLGILCEFIFQAGDGAILCSPVPILYNNDGPVIDAIYYSITNLGISSQVITATLTVLPMGT